MGEPGCDSFLHYDDVDAYPDQRAVHHVDTENAASPGHFQGEGHEQWDTYAAHEACDSQERTLNNSTYLNVAPPSSSPDFAENMSLDVFGTGAHASSQVEVSDAAQYMPTNTIDQPTTTCGQNYLQNPSQGQENLPDIVVDPSWIMPGPSQFQTLIWQNGSGYDSCLDVTGGFDDVVNDSGGFGHDPTISERVHLTSFMPQLEISDRYFDRYEKAIQ
ncbi:hypothetical protein N0V94_008279 [Neodidymelliopsis sp. IMI 364377]|nr:hypothetical protein N0V94_008279 [Neodidymelliopsis sp. IMI 364377]